MVGYHLIIELLRGLAKLADTFPDNPRLGRRLLLLGGFLFSAILIHDSSTDVDDAFFVLKYLSVISGGVSVILGSFVFFRRWVWKRQDNRPPVITSLRLK